MKLSGPIIHSNYSINQFSSFNYINPEDIKKNLEQLKKINANILIVSINSPGGTVSASKEIYEILKDYKKNNQIKKIPFSKIFPYVIAARLTSLSTL